MIKFVQKCKAKLSCKATDSPQVISKDRFTVRKKNILHVMSDLFKPIQKFPRNSFFLCRTFYKSTSNNLLQFCISSAVLQKELSYNCWTHGGQRSFSTLYEVVGRWTDPEVILDAWRTEVVHLVVEDDPSRLGHQ